MLNFNASIIDSIGNYHLLKIQYPNQKIEYVLGLYLPEKDNYTQSDFPYKILKISETFFNLPSYSECYKLHN